MQKQRTVTMKVPSWKVVGKVFLAGIGVAFLVLLAALLFLEGRRTGTLEKLPISVIAQPVDIGSDRVVLCMVAIQGPTRLLSMDCLQQPFQKAPVTATPVAEVPKP